MTNKKNKFYHITSKLRSDGGGKSGKRENYTTGRDMDISAALN